MKLRFNNNSLRLRLTQKEVDQIANGESVSNSITFSPTSLFSYTVIPDHEISNIKASSSANSIAIHIPMSQAKDWANSVREGIYYDQGVSEDTILKILIEKDFQCLHKRAGEDETDNFPNPRA